MIRVTFKEARTHFVIICENKLCAIKFVSYVTELYAKICKLQYI